MRNNITEIVFVLDRSGSMYSIASDTIGGFNSTLESQRKHEGKAYVSTMLFNSKLLWLHDRLPISEVKPMTATDYCPSGVTALFDALGRSIEHIENIHKYARKEDVPKHTMFVIMTDGLENASRQFCREDIKRMIRRKKRKGWEFIFLGANIDAAAEACSIGISRERAANFHADGQGQQMSFRAVDKALSNLRSSDEVGSIWKEELDEDFESRKGHL